MGANAEPQVSLTSQSGFVGPLTHERIRPCSCEPAFARLSARHDGGKVTALNRYFCRDLNPESWKDPLRCFLMGAACSSRPLVQAFIVTPSDLLTSYATVRWQRASLSSHFPEHSGSVTKSSFTSRSRRCSLPAKNKEDTVQSDQGRTHTVARCGVRTRINKITCVTKTLKRADESRGFSLCKNLQPVKRVEVHVTSNCQKNLLAPERVNAVKDIMLSTTAPC